VTESKTEHALLSPEEYVQRVKTFLNEATGWCKDQDLTVKNDVVTLREELIAEYEAPSLYISKDDVLLAKILPVGSKIIGARGRVDLIGRVARHALLFQVGNRPTSSTQTAVGRKTINSSSAPKLSKVEEDGWYWIEARIRRPKRVEESLFLDLLTDVSDYEFE
jgi:hypothetical protein